MVDHVLNLEDIEKHYIEDEAAVSEWLDDQYDSTFAQYFKEQRELYNRLKSSIHPITDDELETILTLIPLELFTVAEVINQYRLKEEVVKLSIKQKESKLEKSSTESTATKRKEFAVISVIEDKILLSAYDTLITRVENEISFSRELIMGAKKIWDSRRRTEDSNPVGNIDEYDELPEYNQNMNRSAYIK